MVEFVVVPTHFPHSHTVKLVTGGALPQILLNGHLVSSSSQAMKIFSLLFHLLQNTTCCCLQHRPEANESLNSDQLVQLFKLGFCWGVFFLGWELAECVACLQKLTYSKVSLYHGIPWHWMMKKPHHPAGKFTVKENQMFFFSLTFFTEMPLAYLKFDQLRERRKLKIQWE